MEWLSRSRLGLLLGLALALAGLLAVVSFAPQDPTLTNLRYPKDGIGNWLGYPGALLAGSLVEGFGWAALAVPAAALYWTLFRAGRPRLWRYALQTGALLLLAASWSGQWTQVPALGLASPGLIGWSGAQWARRSLGPAAGAALTLGLALAVWHQLYAAGWRERLGVRSVARLATVAGWREAGAWVRDEARQLHTAGGSALGTILLVPLHAVGWLAAGAALTLRGALRALGGLRDGAGTRRRGSHTLESAQVVQRPAYGAHARAESGAAFDDWLAPELAVEQQPAGLTGAERLAQAAEAARSAQAGGYAAAADGKAAPRETPPAAAGPPLPPAGSGPERWELLLRRYRENLDLDWDSQWRSGPAAVPEAGRKADGHTDGGAPTPRRPK